MNRSTSMNSYWSQPVNEMMGELKSTPNGLDQAEAIQRIQKYGRNIAHPDYKHTKVLWMLLNQIKSPLVLILIIAAIVSLIVHDLLDAVIVLAIVF